MCGNDVLGVRNDRLRDARIAPALARSRGPREAPEGPALFGEGGDLFVEGTIDALLTSFRERGLPGEINEAGTNGAALVVESVMNEGDWLYWGDLVHTLAADAGARGASVT